MMRVLKREDIPTTGTDFFLIDQVVAQMLREIRESNVNVFALILWAGFRQTTLPYVKKRRRSGVSGWSFSQKFKLLVDSIVGFSFFPIRVISVAGLLTAFMGFGYALLVIVNHFWQDEPVQGWSSLIVTVLIMGGLNLAAMGVLGEYIWRALDEIRGRPIHTIEAVFGLDSTVDGSLDIPRQTPIVSNANVTDQV
jgi:dolichol-phosphate mannosyltransferase